MLATKKDGFLWIGDPHVCSRKVGRRKDDYLASVLEKLSVCATLSNERNLQAVCLGDLFHRSDDNNLKMLNMLMRVLKEFSTPMLVLEGNHDKELTSLSDSDALMLLQQAGVVKVCSSMEVLPFEIAGTHVSLWMVPDGTDIPDAVLGDDVNIMVTHHDLAIGSSYPGALPLKEIDGVAFVVNGHMHDTKKPVKVGATWWHNPGNLEPLSIDLESHVPKAWVWTPDMPYDHLEGVLLPHGLDLFDRTGVQVEAGDAENAVEQLVGGQGSAFAELLASDNAMDAAITDEAAILKEDLEEVLASSGATPAAAMLLRHLAGQLSAT